MNEPGTIIEHKGAYILYSDYSGMGGDELLKAIEAHYAAHKKMISRGQTNLLFLTNVKDAYADKAVVNMFKKSAAEHAQHMAKSAVVGVVGIQKVLLNGINMFSSTETKVFDTLDEAKDWLAS